MKKLPKKTVAKKAVKKAPKKVVKKVEVEKEPRFITLCSTKSDHTGKTLQFDLNSMDKDQFELVVKSLEKHFEYSNNRINGLEILRGMDYVDDEKESKRINTKFTIQNFIIGTIAVFVTISIIMQL